MQDSLNNDFWKKFSFSGNVTYSETEIDEDMLQVEYPEKLILDAGFYCGTFIVYIIWDNNWQLPVAVYSCRTVENFEKIINLAIEQVEKEVIQKRFSYYGRLWKTIEIKI
ncbi:MAG: hypothetical protein K2J39_01530 [Ruminococcus sp.]|nr:hypothetical protein [Ruminococcus sp.]